MDSQVRGIGRGGNGSRDYISIQDNFQPIPYATSKKVIHAFGVTLSRLGFCTFAGGIAAIAILATTTSLLGMKFDYLKYPTYLLISGGVAFLVGEICKHLSEREIVRLNVTNTNYSAV